jgi:hypothetical protein
MVVNKLPIATCAEILAMLTEGASMRSVSRLADVFDQHGIEAAC